MEQMRSKRLPHALPTPLMLALDRHARLYCNRSHTPWWAANTTRQFIFGRLWRHQRVEPDGKRGVRVVAHTRASHNVSRSYAFTYVTNNKGV